MYIRWQKRTRRTPWHYRADVKDDVHHCAILVESVRVNGKPSQRHVAYVVGFTDTQAQVLAQRCHCWNKIKDVFDRVAISRQDRRRLETQIAAKLPRPTRREWSQFKREQQALWGE
jgi:hypothetical protein